MTKGEMKAAIDANPSNRRSPAWAEAFKAHRAATKMNLKMGCGGCHEKVYKWLSQ